jgi:hypothetical protein
LKDLSEVLEGPVRDPRRICQRSLTDLRRSSKDLSEVLEGCPGDPRRISRRSFNDVRTEIEHVREVREGSRGGRRHARTCLRHANRASGPARRSLNKGRTRPRSGERVTNCRRRRHEINSTRLPAG